jgi:hypothetical protein
MDSTLMLHLHVWKHHMHLCLKLSTNTTPAAFVLQGFGIRHAMNPDPYRGVFGNNGKA